MMRVVPHLRLLQAGNAKVTLPVDVGKLFCQAGCCFSIDGLVNTFTIRETFLEMHERRIIIQPLVQGYGTNL